LLIRHKTPVDNTSFFDFRVFVRKEEKTNKNKQKQAKKRERTKNKM